MTPQQFKIAWEKRYQTTPPRVGEFYVLSDDELASLGFTAALDYKRRGDRKCKGRERN